MKHTYIFISLMLISIFTFAQKPVKKDVGFTFGLSNFSVNTKNSPTGSLIFKYMVSDKTALRLGFKYGNSKNTQKSDTAGLGIDTTRILKAYNWALNFGFQKSLGKIAKLEPFVGADLLVGRTGGSYDYKTEVVSSGNPNIYGDYLQIHTTDYGKGSFFGAKLFAGANFYFSDHIALGAEFGYGFMLNRTRNGASTQIIEGSTFGTPGTVYSSNSGSTENKSVDTNGSGTLTLSVFF